MSVFLLYSFHAMNGSLILPETSSLQASFFIIKLSAIFANRNVRRFCEMTFSIKK
ncbi:hypothetical protein BAME_02230 [Bacillus sp. M 2-6]|nr:hypothetical protein BAME_02230 [Bacillus sp. M 2-6]